MTDTTSAQKTVDEVAAAAAGAARAFARTSPRVSAVAWPPAMASRPARRDWPRCLVRGVCSCGAPGVLAQFAVLSARRVAPLHARDVPVYPPVYFMRVDHVIYFNEIELYLKLITLIISCS